MRKRLPALLACALAAAAGGCGGESREADATQIRSVVTQFAESGDAHACDLLSPEALVEIYGAFRKPVPVARRECVRRSTGFRGEPVTITKLNFVDAATARVTALNPAGDVTYSVDVRRFGPAWRIDAISQSKTDR